MSLSRREFVFGAVAAAGLAGAGWWALGRRGLVAPSFAAGYGPLRPVADEATGLELLRLPEGFRYRSLSWAGEPLGDGRSCPDNHDGMGVVGEEGSRVTLVRNHERKGSAGGIGAASDSYDVTGGGTTTMVFDTASEALVDSRVSLSGTLNNCAGGVTPWGTWLSCEEAVFRPADTVHGLPVRVQGWGLERAARDHGWVFEVPADGIAAPVPLTDMGQFSHEAVAFDPDTGIAWLTEDAYPDAGLYRFVPREVGDLAAGGRLQMLRVPGQRRLKRQLDGGPWPVEWVDIDEPRQGNRPGSHDTQGVVAQGLAAGGTAFEGLEGVVFEHGRVTFTSKSGGVGRLGAVFQLDLATESLALIYEAPPGSTVSGPDNLVMSPRGALVICEDRLGRSGSRAGQYMLGLTAQGDLFPFARTNPEIAAVHGGHDLGATLVNSEWAGACFSGDGRWLFANLQEPGVTLVITGPWQDGLV